ncbi:MAG: outer membrane protein assembly factor BamE [Rhodospirillales bacterium]|nr:outer membrane protein assembly factor BamE [Rhodospirillales bacterium]MCB9995512.1 outer membrane protein assembly factor BamE [Rhodospirillales bacterium]
MKNFRWIACTALAASFMTGCTPTHTIRGNMLEDYQVEEVVAGKDTRSDVLRKLGSPTTKATFDDSIWYYLGQETEKRGILDPKVVDERVVVVFFDEEGVVQEIKDVDNDRVELPYVRRKTPTTGNDVTVMQQLLGNLGKFNKEEAPE